MANTLHPHSVLEQAGLASGLLTQDQIDHAWHELVRSPEAANVALDEVSDQLLADTLVRLGHLNRWQAVQLQQGRTKFTLGPYRIVDTIGYGGMGYVFKCEHTLLGRIEAIKVLPRTQTDQASLGSFLREIRAQAKLDHPNLVRLTFADRDGDTYFLVTEYVPGSDLRKLIRLHGPLGAVHAAWVASETAKALDYAHQLGLVHRDIKPGNLLVTPGGQLKLTDLGLAAFSSDVRGEATDQPNGGKALRTGIVGTPDFIAPESILRPNEVLPVSDIYSLGCTLYYSVTGKVPFPGGQTKEKLRRHLDQAPITPRRFNPELSETLLDLMAAMMHKRPEERLATAREVIEGLEPWTSLADEASLADLGRLASEAGDHSDGNGQAYGNGNRDADGNGSGQGANGVSAGRASGAAPRRRPHESPPPIILTETHGPARAVEPPSQRDLPPPDRQLGRLPVALLLAAIVLAAAAVVVVVANL